MTRPKFATPEAAHSALIDAIEYELNTWGPASLADMIATLVDDGVRIDDEAPKETDDAWRTVHQEYEELAERLNRLPHVNPKRKPSHLY